MEQTRFDPDPAASAAMPDETLPRSVAMLGYGGLLPFLFLAPASFFDENHALYWADGLFSYGAIILSFVGALHWGYALSLGASSTEAARARRDACFAWSVVPALMAWLALLLPPLLSSLLLIAGFIAHYRQDRRLAAFAGLPAWYLPLRLRLSVVACLGLAVGGWSGFWSHPGNLLPVVLT
ncbi:MAG: DUF3429 domain-containing protein [Sulfuritalea sp.]|nr:DUF3429 domain-containing protein [Sulfuritalea sp.]